MNLYLRYFDDEVVVSSAEEGYRFLCAATNEELDIKHLDNLTSYMESTANFTKRFKIRPRVYYVGIKTDAADISEFKQRGQILAEERAIKAANGEQTVSRMSRFAEEQPGWYEGKLLFKRVVFNIDTSRNEYIDTEFSAIVKAHSIEDLYGRLCDYLHTRPDIDPRSQLPSIKGHNFQYEYIGMTLPEDVHHAVMMQIEANGGVDPELGVAPVVNIDIE